MTGTLYEDPYTFFISRSVLLVIRNVSDKSCRENQHAHFMSSNFFFFLENRASYEIMVNNFVESDRTQMAMWRMRIGCRTPKATNTPSEYAILWFSTATVVA
jgi:hypothetical protein